MDFKDNSPTNEGHLLDSFPDGTVVQFLGDQPDESGDVIPLSDATINITADGVTAVAEDGEWSWMFDDLESVLHGRDEPWTIFAVPDVSDFGVAVPPFEVDRFRRELDKARGVEPIVAAPDPSPRDEPPPDKSMDAPAPNLL